VNTASWGPGHPLCERYEQLRSHVLKGSVLPGQAHGFGVLLRQGMRAWMEACESYIGPVETASLGGAARSRDSGILASAVQKELTLLMAAMVLNNSHREGEPTWRPIPR